jgi:flagellin
MTGLDPNSRQPDDRHGTPFLPPAPWPQNRERVPRPAGWLRFESGWLNAGQTLRNLETAVSLLQTADVGMAGLASTMSEAITRLHVAWAKGEKTQAPPLEIGAFLARKLEQIDEIARNTRFHGRGLLDGQSGVVGVGSGVDFVRGGAQTRSSPAEGYEVQIQGFPEKASLTGGVAVHEDWVRSEQELFLAEGERFVRYVPEPGMTVRDFLAQLQSAVSTGGLDLRVGLTRQRRLTVRHNQYGSHFKFKGFSRKTPLLSKRPGRMEWSRKGKDIRGTLHGEQAFGIGRMLVGFQENAHTSELAVVWRGDRLEQGTQARSFVVQNGIFFQDGNDPGRERNRLSIPSFYTSSLGRWLETKTGYRSLADARANTWQELADSVQLLFAVSCEADEWKGRVREWIQEYQNLALDYLRKEVPAQAKPPGDVQRQLEVERMAEVMRNLISREDASLT